MNEVHGFTLIELITSLVILGVLSSFLVSRVVDLKHEARIASLQGVAAAIRSEVQLIQMKAHAVGLKAVGSNPGGNQQSNFLISTDAGSFEVDWRNLCPESRAELGSKATILDLISVDPNNTKYQTNVTNQSTWIGYALPPERCYVVYDSFACTVNLDTTDC